jgi:hypothetical protein
MEQFEIAEDLGRLSHGGGIIKSAWFPRHKRGALATGVFGAPPRQYVTALKFETSRENPRKTGAQQIG